MNDIANSTSLPCLLIAFLFFFFVKKFTVYLLEVKDTFLAVFVQKVGFCNCIGGYKKEYYYRVIRILLVLRIMKLFLSV